MNKTYKLNTGFNIPMVGVGTYRIDDSNKIHEVVDCALSVGYRHFDTAICYRNDVHLGEAFDVMLPKYNLKREDIFLTSKIIPAVNQTEADITSKVKSNIRNLLTNYIDLYLIHWPGVTGLNVSSSENRVYRKMTWSVLAKLHKEGVIRSIGVSNYTIAHLKELLADDEGVPPAVNQVEWHPRYKQPDLAKFCQENNIFLQAYSSLGTSDHGRLRYDPFIVEIAEKINRSPIQLLLRWAYQQNIGILPKASCMSHIQENFDLHFEIPEEEMQKLNNIKLKEKFAWDPSDVV